MLSEKPQTVADAFQFNQYLSQWPLESNTGGNTPPTKAVQPNKQKYLDGVCPFHHQGLIEQLQVSIGDLFALIDAIANALLQVA